MNSDFATQLVAASAEGRYGDALAMILNTFAHEEDLSRHFISMFEWMRLVPEYPPAREAMIAERDAQAVRLLAGEHQFGSPEMQYCQSRLAVIVEMNRALCEPHATYQVFAQFYAIAPVEARRRAFLALPDVVAAGDYALAEQFLGDPLMDLPRLNEVARSLPLFPVGRTAPRVASELTNFITDVRLLSTVLAGTGRQQEADALRQAALAGIESSELRELGARELSEPGTITRELVPHQMKESP